ncbi:DUF4440 domain-containing protein [Nocardia mangyaensis]|uniref:DUF4440 domain-containing protein n=1 Tax=Nocardia mangyaensis TaxID=2213200 RepID=A0A1J0VP18_9NOCA|nr:SgcJ/EcaC family oxidoreductase [Nocardia mangyaensis]APE33766.1 DUF4440 domain-containing protein [Nocardia mangyaensis]
MSNEVSIAGHTPPDLETEIAAIRAVVATVARAQANELVEEFVGVFRDDAIWTIGHGKKLFGRNAIGEFTAQVLPGGSPSGRVAYELEHVLFLRPDVAAVKARQPHYPLGDELDGEGAPLYVTTKEDGRWLLAANQNTPVIG